MIKGEYKKDCVFCKKFDGLDEEIQHLDFEPLDPTTPGHWLVIPRQHVSDFTEWPMVTASTMFRAAVIAQERGGDFNLITSKGKAATQSVFHLHVHLVPRKEGDGLKLPWTDQVVDK